MSDITPEQIQKILETINTALINHNKWYEDLMRTLLCRTQMAESFIALDAHRKCKFGCWFYNQTDSSFHNLPSATQIGELHKIMHDSARFMCLKMRTSGMVQKKDYDCFVQNLANFRKALKEFRQRILVTLETLTPK